MSDNRVGVFICDCGHDIAGTIDTQALERQVRELAGVALVRRLRYSCSPDGLSTIRAAIRENNLERLVVAGCTPRTLAPLFQRMCQEAGLTRDEFELVDLREGCAWVHPAEPQAALSKALDLIRMGVASVVRQTRCAEISAKVVPAVLVIGGGLAGLTAAEVLGRAGVPVTLVERDSTLGGMLRGACTLCPGGNDASQLLDSKIQAVTGQRGIQVLLNSQVTEVSGTPGCYEVTVAPPPSSARDSSVFEVGAVIVATGGCLPPVPKSLGYDGQQVVTQQEFDRELGRARQGSSSVISSPRAIGHSAAQAVSAVGAGLRNVVMLPCAGRQQESGRQCSELCCRVALQQAMQVKALVPDGQVTILLEDGCIADGGTYQAQLEEARLAGVHTVRYSAVLPPKVSGSAVQLQDALTGTTQLLFYECLVLGLPLVPQPDAGMLAHMLRLPQDEQGFFPQVRYRLRPQHCVDRGIYVCGTAHYPTDWREAQFQAMNAAFDALRQVQAAMVSSLAPIAAVEQSLCTGCGNCVTSCSFAAIEMRKREGVLDLAAVDALLCVGCGNCVVTCPTKAISLSRGSDAQILAQIEAALADRAQDGSTRILLLGCEWSGHAAAELAGARRLSYPSTIRPISLRCSARCDPLHILWAFLNGADGVLLAACPPGDCHYLSGNHYARERIESLRGLLASAGFDPRRLRLEWIIPDDPQDFVKKVTVFAQLIQALG